MYLFMLILQIGFKNVSPRNPSIMYNYFLGVFYSLNRNMLDLTYVYF